MTTGHLDTTAYNNQVANAASQVKISSTVFKSFIADVKDKIDSNYDLLDVNNENAIGMKRQALINGNFDVWQRGTSFTNPAANAYTADRFRVLGVPNGGTFPTVTHSRGTIINQELTGSRYYYIVDANGAGTSLGASSIYLMNQLIENGVRFLCGTGKKITLSFYAKSTTAGKRLGINMDQNYGTGGSPSAAESIVGTIFTLTTSWQKYSYTFTTNTLSGKTFGTNNDDYLSIGLAFQWGSTSASFFGGGTAESFVVGQTHIAQVQVNAGDQALPFQPRSFSEELLLCQRYYEKVNTATCAGYSTTNALISINYKVVKRVAATLSLVTVGSLVGNGGSAVVISMGAPSGNGVEGVGGADLVTGGGLVATGSYNWRNGVISADAEL